MYNKQLFNHFKTSLSFLMMETKLILFQIGIGDLK